MMFENLLNFVIILLFQANISFLRPIFTKRIMHIESANEYLVPNDKN